MSLAVSEYPLVSIIIGPPMSGGLTDVLTRVPFSFFWKGLRSIKDLFFLGIAVEIGNDRGTRF